MDVIDYSVTCLSSASFPAEVTYTNPADGQEVSFYRCSYGMWFDRFLIPKPRQPLELVIWIIGPYPMHNSCGITINGTGVTGEAGESPQPGMPVVCDYTILPG
jgi:hypothetical protein